MHIYLFAQSMEMYNNEYNDMIRLGNSTADVPSPDVSPASDVIGARTPVDLIFKCVAFTLHSIRRSRYRILSRGLTVELSLDIQKLND